VFRDFSLSSFLFGNLKAVHARRLPTFLSFPPFSPFGLSLILNLRGAPLAFPAVQDLRKGAFCTSSSLFPFFLCVQRNIAISGVKSAPLPAVYFRAFHGPSTVPAHVRFSLFFSLQRGAARRSLVLSGFRLCGRAALSSLVTSLSSSATARPPGSFFYPLFPFLSLFGDGVGHDVWPPFAWVPASRVRMARAKSCAGPFPSVFFFLFDGGTPQQLPASRRLFATSRPTGTLYKELFYFSFLSRKHPLFFSTFFRPEWLECPFEGTPPAILRNIDSVTHSSPSPPSSYPSSTCSRDLFFRIILFPLFRGSCCRAVFLFPPFTVFSPLWGDVLGVGQPTFPPPFPSFLPFALPLRLHLAPFFLSVVDF